MVPVSTRPYLQSRIGAILGGVADMEPLVLMGAVVVLSFALVAVVGSNENVFTVPSVSLGKPEVLDVDGEA